jgi:hypothetical protein
VSVDDAELVYDWDEFDRRIEPEAPAARRPRGGMGAAVLAAALWAIDDVVMGEKQRTPVVEEAAMPQSDPDELVEVFLIPGQPHLSWARVRGNS